MERQQFWIFIFIAAAFGLAMHWIQNSDPKASLSTHAGRIYNPDDFEPAATQTSQVYKRIRASSPPAEQEPQVAGLAPAGSEHQGEASPGSSGGQAAPQDGQAKPAKELTPEEKKKEEEKKKKEEENKKKKKKKKKKAEGEGEGKKSPEDETDKETAENDDDDSSDIATAAPQEQEYIGGHIGAFDGIPRTLKEWEEYLLGDPDFKRTTLFIKHFQNGIIEADIFYPIIDKMLDDDRTKMRELAVTALGATPNARSFAYLSDLFANETGQTNLRKQVQVYLRTYVQLPYLPILATALKSDELNQETTIEALRLLQAAANMHLKNLRPDQPTEQGQGGHQTPRGPATSSVLRSFDMFTPVLTRMSQTSASGDIRHYAAQTLSNIQTLMQPHAG